jgi:hypothetical protein
MPRSGKKVSIGRELRVSAPVAPRFGAIASAAQVEGEGGGAGPPCEEGGQGGDQRGRRLAGR